MNFETLHLCNINHQLDIDDYIDLVSENDAVIFYSKNMEKLQFNNIIALFNNNKVYFVIDQNTHNLETITYDTWLSLVNLYRKTFTWK